MDIQNILVPQMPLLTILTASIVPLLIVAWLLAPLLCRLIAAAAKVSVCTIALIAIIALYNLSAIMDIQYILDIQYIFVPHKTLLTASAVPLIIVAWLLAPLLCRLIVAVAKVSVYTIPLIAIIALGFHLKRKIDAAEEERMRRIAAAEYEQRERMRRIAVAEYEQKERQQEESLRRAKAQLQAEVQRRMEAERRAEAERMVNIMRRTGVRPTTPPRSPPRQPELSGPAAWIANVFETIARASGDAAAASG